MTVQDRTGGIQLPGEDNWNRTTGTGQPCGRASRTGQPEQASQNRTIFQVKKLVYFQKIILNSLNKTLFYMP
jgi:hypothetical protein